MSAPTVSDLVAIDDAIRRITPYLKPGFAEAWREAGKTVGYRKLGKHLRWVNIPETNGERETIIVQAHARPAARKPRKTRDNRGLEVCCFAWRYTRTGRVRNRKHWCSEVCQWTDEQALDWCRRTPYPTKSEPTRRVEPPRCRCGRSQYAHYELVTNTSGFIEGYREIRCFARHGLYDWWSGPASIIAGVRAPEPRSPYQRTPYARSIPGKINA